MRLSPPCSVRPGKYQRRARLSGHVLLEQGDPVIGQHDVTRPPGLAGSNADRARIPVEVSDVETDDLAISTAGQKRALYQRSESGPAGVDKALRFGMAK